MPGLEAFAIDPVEGEAAAEVREAVRRFAQARIAPLAADIDPSSDRRACSESRSPGVGAGRISATSRMWS